MKHLIFMPYTRKAAQKSITLKKVYQKKINPNKIT